MLGIMSSLVAAVGDKGDSLDIGSIIGYIVVGAIVGVLARFLVPGRDPMGIVLTIVLGIVGAVIGGWAAGAIFSETSGVDWIASILAAIALVLIWRAVAGNRVRTYRSEQRQLRRGLPRSGRAAIEPRSAGRRRPALRASAHHRTHHRTDPVALGLRAVRPGVQPLGSGGRGRDRWLPARA